MIDPWTSMAQTCDWKRRWEPVGLKCHERATVNRQGYGGGHIVYFCRKHDEQAMALLQRPAETQQAPR